MKGLASSARAGKGHGTDLADGKEKQSGKMPACEAHGGSPLRVAGFP